MKKFVLSVVLLAFFSCSDDDPVIPEPEVIKPTLVSKMTVLREGAPEDVFHFTYDAKHRMQKITYDEGINTVELRYNDADLVNRMVFNGNPNTLDFFYNDQNIPVAYQNSDGTLLPVNYNAEMNFYTFGPSSYLLNAIGDIQSTTRVHYSYTDKKGIFANVVGPNIIMMQQLVGLFVSVGSKVAMEKVYNDKSQMFEIETTYNDSGYPVKIEYTGLLPLHPNRTYMLEY